MTSTSSLGNAPSQSEGAPKGKQSWSDFLPKYVSNEDAMDTKRVSEVWEKMYRQAGLSSPTEGERKSFRLGIYVYCCKNGTSREGDYSGTITLANGTNISASVIPAACGKMNIRKFMRGNLTESYEALKDTQIMMTDGRFVAKYAAYSISAENAFATADWMADCPMFTPAESKAHNTVFTKSIDRARRARGGRTLEEVEENRVNDAIRVNGPGAEPDSGTEW